MFENKINKKKNKGHKPKRPTWPLKPTKPKSLSFLSSRITPDYGSKGALMKLTWESWIKKKESYSRGAVGKQKKEKRKESYSRGGAGKVRKERKIKRSTARKRRKEKKKKKREEGMLKHNPNDWIRQKLQNLQTSRSSWLDWCSRRLD